MRRAGAARGVMLTNADGNIDARMRRLRAMLGSRRAALDAPGMRARFGNSLPLFLISGMPPIYFRALYFHAFRCFIYLP